MSLSPINMEIVGVEELIDPIAHLVFGLNNWEGFSKEGMKVW